MSMILTGIDKNGRNIETNEELNSKEIVVYKALKDAELTDDEIERICDEYEEEFSELIEDFLGSDYKVTKFDLDYDRDMEDTRLVRFEKSWGCEI